MRDLYSNCVILEFTKPLTRAQLDYIALVMAAEIDDRRLPKLNQRPVCGEREGNAVIPTIAADEC